MDLQTWLAFFAASCLIAVSPGSGAVLSMSHGLSYGVRKTGATIAGLQAGLLLILLIAVAREGRNQLAEQMAKERQERQAAASAPAAAPAAPAAPELPGNPDKNSL